MSSHFSKDDNNSESDGDDFCPSLPPYLLKQKANNDAKIIGPSLPPGMTEKYLPELASISQDQSDSESDELIGPMPLTTEEDFIKAEHERKYLLMKQNLNKNADKALVRESWMTELPEEKSKLSIFGLGSRTFASKTPAEKGDVSGWTDSPTEKEMKTINEVLPEGKKRDRSKSPEQDEDKITNLIESYNLATERDSSLYEMHSKKKKKDEPIVKERKPFSREDDLHVNKFDKAQKASIIKKAQKLDDRFSKGNKRYL